LGIRPHHAFAAEQFGYGRQRVAARFDMLKMAKRAHFDTRHPQPQRPVIVDFGRSQDARRLAAGNSKGSRQALGFCGWIGPDGKNRDERNADKPDNRK
jgi:hypothetical protein